MTTPPPPLPNLTGPSCTFGNMSNCVLPWAWAQAVLSIWNTFPLSTSLNSKLAFHLHFKCHFPREAFPGPVPVPSEGNTTHISSQSTLFFPSRASFIMCNDRFIKALFNNHFLPQTKLHENRNCVCFHSTIFGNGVNAPNIYLLNTLMILF